MIKMNKIYILLFFLILSSLLFAQENNLLIDIRDNKTYKTIKIGNQTFMAENLAYIPKNVEINKAGYAVYGYNSENIDSLKLLENYFNFGVLYTWETARNSCPDGWHLPEKEEFDMLLYVFANNDSIAYKSLIYGGNSGFSAVLGGYMTIVKKFSTIGSEGIYFSNTEFNSDFAWVLTFSELYHSAVMIRCYKNAGYSVRCIKD